MDAYIIASDESEPLFFDVSLTIVWRDVPLARRSFRSWLSYVLANLLILSLGLAGDVSNIMEFPDCICTYMSERPVRVIIVSKRDSVP